MCILIIQRGEGCNINVTYMYVSYCFQVGQIYCILKRESHDVTSTGTRNKQALLWLRHF